jgi:protein ImuB
MFAAFHIPDFPVVAALRNHAARRDFPSAILAVRPPHEPQEKLPLLSLNRAARAAGIHPGWPLNRALVRCPNLCILPRDPVAESSLRDELTDLAESITPDIEITATDAVVLDLSGRKSPVGAAFISGIELWQARAGTPDLAHLAARHETMHKRFISPADLAQLPLGVLASVSQDPSPLRLLDLWGLKTLGDFMELPRQALIERLGLEVGQWHDLLHGKTCRLLRLHRPPESFAQSFDFEDGVIALDPLVFALKRLLHTLAGRLGARHLAAGALHFRLILETGSEMARRVRLPEPQTAVEGMLSPLQTLLESLRLDAAVVTLQLDAETTFATATQREWFGRHLPQPERWAETLAKLEALLGQGRVGIPSPPESFRPDAFTLHPTKVSVSSVNPDCPVPLRRFRPPREIAVAYESRDLQPWPLALLNGPHPGEIIDRRGPFLASGTWWDPAGRWKRLEWDVQLASRHLLRLVFQTPDRWQLEGIYQ